MYRIEQERKIKMKKLISVLLAVSALALSTSAFAAPSLSDARNDVTVLGEASDALALPILRNEDTVTFSLTGLTGDQLTLISSKVGATADNTTIQYINQYTPSGDSQAVSYKLRGLAGGVYNIRIKDGEDDVVNYFYKVATPSVVVAVNSAGGELIVDDGKGTQGFAVYAKVDGGATFTETGAEVTVTLTDGTLSYVDTITGAELDTVNAEVAGSITAIYGIKVSGVPADVTLDIDAEMND